MHRAITPCPAACPGAPVRRRLLTIFNRMFLLSLPGATSGFRRLPGGSPAGKCSGFISNKFSSRKSAF